jgi:hypothetical protein
MKFFHRLYFFNPSKDKKDRRELFIASDSIDFLSWYKNELEEGTTLHLAMRSADGIPVHRADGLPDIINNGVFDGLFFKCTAHRAVQPGGEMKKYSVWINPDNIAYFHQVIPGSTIFYFRSGGVLAIANDVENVRKALIEHSKQFKERKNKQYGKGKGKEAGF